MPTKWITKSLSPSTLHLDPKNPRLGRESTSSAPREIIQYLFDHDKAVEVAESIARRGYFPNEPLLAVREDDRWVVVEGNRRLAALKALREPALLEGSYGRQVERLARSMIDSSLISTVPVTVAPSRKATDRQIAGRHVGTPVLAWRSENRASFILDKLAEGYDNDSLRDELGFTLADIQGARQTRAIADMARSLDLPDEVKAKIEGPKAKIFTTLERVFDSKVGRAYLHATPDPEHGLKIGTTKKEFKKAFTKLVTDAALGKASSRNLNTSDNIKNYFDAWDEEEHAKKKRGSCLPSDIIKGKTISAAPAAKPQSSGRSKPESKTVIPRSFKIRYGTDRLIDLRRELVKLKREENPNAGAVLLRVFFELSMLHYLERRGELAGIIARIEAKQKRKLPHGVPTMKEIVVEAQRLAQTYLNKTEASQVIKAVRYDANAPFTITDLHGFVHSNDLPSARDIQQFWARTEPLFKLMLDEEIEEAE